MAGPSVVWRGEHCPSPRHELVAPFAWGSPLCCWMDLLASKSRPLAVPPHNPSLLSVSRTVLRLCVCLVIRFWSANRYTANPLSTKNLLRPESCINHIYLITYSKSCSKHQRNNIHIKVKCTKKQPSTQNSNELYNRIRIKLITYTHNLLN